MEKLETIVDPVITRDRIKAFEKELLRFPQCEVPVTHRYLDGLYSREVTLKKGTLLTSKTHKTENISIISQGSVVEVTEEKDVRVIKAPHTMISTAGMKRVLYVLEDTVWTTVHKNTDNLRDIKELELMIIDTEADLLETGAKT